MYKSETLAKYLIALIHELAGTKSINESTIINMSRMHILLYAVYGFYLALYDKRISKESPVTWPYGVGFPRVSETVSPITLYSTQDKVFENLRKDEKANDLIINVLYIMGGWETEKLMQWAFRPGTPWHKTIRSSDWKGWGTPIKDEYIKEFFSEQIEE